MLEKIKRLIPQKVFKFLQPIYHFLMSFFAAIYHRFPSGHLIVIGVTGTAGKTSTVYLIAKMLQAAGYKTGFTSTTIFSDGKSEWLNDKKMTMPGRFFIQHNLRRMVKNHCRYAVIETTSEGIKQFRHRFIDFDSVIFTGLYPEHIESHGSFDKYRETKGKLFKHLHNCPTKYVNDRKEVCYPKSAMEKLDLHRIKKTIVVNGDDDAATYFLNFWSEAKIIYSLVNNFNPESLLNSINSEMMVKDLRFVKGENVQSLSRGTQITINNEVINLKLLGEFNALNALAAYGVGLDQGLSPEEIRVGLESVTSLAGKMEMIDAGQDFTAIVDYSFEPKAMEKLYETIDLIPHNRVIHLLGSTGGGRDKARRPVLGSMAGKKADIVIVTNEDPYDEDPNLIIEQVAIGAEDVGKKADKDLFKILDRRLAIQKALELVKTGDLVLFTGKGAEQYICEARGEKKPWDEREEVKKAIGDKLCIDRNEKL